MKLGSKVNTLNMVNTVTVKVPATTANLGPGFDCIGAALTLYNEFKFSLLTSEDKPFQINVLGPGVLSTGADNLLYQSFVKLYEDLGKKVPSVQIDIVMEVPLARGLGSSATAIVGGLLAANAFTEEPLNQMEVMQQAIALEGHPDNVVPALLGGCRLAVTNQRNWNICDIPWHSNIIPVVAIPDFELSTAKARQVLPQEYSRADAIFNAAHLGLLVRGLETGRGDWLQTALQDRIHQPYRKTLIPGYDAVRKAALDAGALEIVISGAGPTLLALVEAPQVRDVVLAMGKAWKFEGVTADARSLALDTRGATVAIADLSTEKR